MKLGIHVPQSGPASEPGLLCDFAQMAEGLGFDSLWVSDHIVIPRAGSAAHPGTGPEYHIDSETRWLESIGTLTYLAGLTQRVQLGTSVLVVPQRNPILLAKQLATVDVLSRGRLVFGAGIGWWAAEFEALAAPYERRGPRTDEYLEVIRRCWMEAHPTFSGRYYQFEDVGFYPKPVQQPRPPVWIGAYTSPGFRRAGRAGDGLFLSRTPAAEIPAAWAETQEAARAAGRDLSALTLTSFARLRWETDAEAEHAAQFLSGLKGAGVHHIVLHFSSGVPHPLNTPNASIESARRSLERFMDHVRPAAGI